jgi:hypothetical protein
MKLTGLGINAIAKAKSAQFHDLVQKLWKGVQSIQPEHLDRLQQLNTYEIDINYIQLSLEILADIPTTFIEQSFSSFASDIIEFLVSLVTIYTFSEAESSEKLNTLILRKENADLLNILSSLLSSSGRSVQIVSDENTRVDGNVKLGVLADALNLLVIAMRIYYTKHPLGSAFMVLETSAVRLIALIHHLLKQSSSSNIKKVSKECLYAYLRQLYQPAILF